MRHRLKEFMRTTIFRRHDKLKNPMNGFYVSPKLILFHEIPQKGTLVDGKKWARERLARSLSIGKVKRIKKKDILYTSFHLLECMITSPSMNFNKLPKLSVLCLNPSPKQTLTNINF